MPDNAQSLSLLRERLRLVPPKETETLVDIPGVYQGQTDTYQSLAQRWQQLGAADRNELVETLLGWNPEQSPARPWTTMPSLAFRLFNSVDFLQYDAFSAILYERLSVCCGFHIVYTADYTPIDAQSQACHFATLTQALLMHPDEIGLAFVLSSEQGRELLRDCPIRPRHIPALLSS